MLRIIRAHLIVLGRGRRRSRRKTQGKARRQRRRWVVLLGRRRRIRRRWGPGPGLLTKTGDVLSIRLLINTGVPKLLSTLRATQSPIMSRRLVLGSSTKAFGGTGVSEWRSVAPRTPRRPISLFLCSGFPLELLIPRRLRSCSKHDCPPFSESNFMGCRTTMPRPA